MFYISCFLLSLVFLAFAYLVIVSRRRRQSSLGRSVAARRRDTDDATLTASELLPISTTSNTDELMQPHLFYLKVGLVGTFRCLSISRVS